MRSFFISRTTSRPARAGDASLAASALVCALAIAQGTPSAAAPALETATVTSTGAAGLTGYDGTVQAVRQAVVAAQVAGAVVALDAKAGDAVKAGQVLLRLDARSAEQAATAGEAQVRSARAQLDAARRDFDRQKQLFDQKYISAAALDRAEAQLKVAQAEAAALLATAGAARTQSDLYVIRAPFAGVVSEVSVVPGDMAMPGRPLLTVYDPRAMRVAAAIPQTVAARVAAAAPTAEVPGTGTERIAPTRIQLLPAVDPATHTQELRLDLPPGAKALAPGMFARVWAPAAEAVQGRLYVPARAVVRRAELTAVYVIAKDGRSLLRQVRTGRAEGQQVEVLSGVSAGERIALDPQAAAAR